jgi:trigger factor
MDIEVLSRKAEGVERRLQVSVSASRVADARERATQRVAGKVRLPGFRPGKAPAAVVRRKFAEEIQQEALESLMRDAYRSVLESEKLEPVTQPHAHDVKFSEGEPLTFELHCEVKPVVELARLSGFRVTRKSPAVTAQMVTDQISVLREQRAAWTPVEEKPREGDMVSVMLAVADADGAIAEGKEYRIRRRTGDRPDRRGDHRARPGRAGGARREVARRLSRRGAGRQEQDRARDAQRREAQVAPAARRHARA